MGGAVGERPCHRGQHALGGRRAGLADVEQDERPGAVGVLRHARGDAGLAEQRRLLVAGDAADRDALGNAAVGRGRCRCGRSTGRSRAGRRSGRRAARRVPDPTNSVRMSHSMVRLALVASVTKRRPPVRFHTSHESIVPMARSSSTGMSRCSSSHAALVPEKYGSSTSPVRSRISGRWPAAASSSQRDAVRRSCHTIAVP